YWLQAHMQTALENDLARVEQSLEEAKRDASLGGRHKDIEELGKQQILLKTQIDGCISARKEAQLRVSDIADPAEYDLSRIPMIFDPSGLKLEELALVAAAYRQMRTGENDEGIENEVKLALLALQNAWSSVNTAKELYSLSLSVARGVAGSFSLGAASKDDWYSALNACSDADIAFKSAVADFEKQANALNQTLAGWLTRNCGWHSEELMPVYASLISELDAAIQAAKEAAELAAKEAAEAEKQNADDQTEQDDASGSDEASGDEDTEDTESEDDRGYEKPDNHTEPPGGKTGG
ncbi:MAG: TolC family protein, partial [Oscillospiraceae bacterium]|nr:TolC family protein [Oscillospiraceae bacterium]